MSMKFSISNPTLNTMNRYQELVNYKFEFFNFHLEVFQTYFSKTRLLILTTSTHIENESFAKTSAVDIKTYTKLSNYSLKSCGLTIIHGVHEILLC